MEIIVYKCTQLKISWGYASMIVAYLVVCGMRLDCRSYHFILAFSNTVRARPLALQILMCGKLLTLVVFDMCG